MHGEDVGKPFAWVFRDYLPDGAVPTYAQPDHVNYWIGYVTEQKIKDILEQRCHKQ